MNACDYNPYELPTITFVGGGDQGPGLPHLPLYWEAAIQSI